MSDKFVHIPPGHKVVVIHPSPKAQIGLTESKLVILDFGMSGDWQTMLANVEAGLSDGTFPSTVTILQLPMIERLDAAGELSAFMSHQTNPPKAYNNIVSIVFRPENEIALTTPLKRKRVARTTRHPLSV